MDDQMMFVYEEVINEALFNGYRIKITYYDSVSGNVKSFKGHVKRIDYFNRCIKLIEKKSDV